MFWPDEPQHMLGLSEYSYKHSHTHTRRSAPKELMCVSVFVYTTGRGEMFLAKAQSGIRRFSLPRTSLTPCCLFLAAVAQVNHSVILLVISDKLSQAAARFLSAHYVSESPRSVGVTGHTENTTPGQWRGTETLSVTEWKTIFQMSAEKNEAAAPLLSDRLKKNVQ